MEDFLLIIVNKVEVDLIPRRTQIAVDISTTEEAKYAITLTLSKRLPTFPLII